MPFSPPDTEKGNRVHMSNAVLKGAGYILVHAPDMVIHNGTTQTTEMVVNPESEYLKELPKNLRPFGKALSYPPNRVYVGAMTPDELKDIEFPWYDKEAADASRFARFGEIMPEDEFIGLMQVVDAFDLVQLADGFAADVRGKLADSLALWHGRFSRRPRYDHGLRYAGQRILGF